MTSPYITPTVREDAAAIVALLRRRNLTRSEIERNFERSKTALDRAFMHARNLGLIEFARVDGTCLWGSTGRIEKLRQEIKAAAIERENARKAKGREEFDFDSVPDMPVIRRIIPAAAAKPVATNAPRWVFEAA